MYQVTQTLTTHGLYSIKHMSQFCNIHVDIHLFRGYKRNIIPQFNNSFVFQCDVTVSLTRYKARGKLFIHQGRTSLYRLFRYTSQCRLNVVFTKVNWYNLHNTTIVTAFGFVNNITGLKSF